MVALAESGPNSYQLAPELPELAAMLERTLSALKDHIEVSPLWHLYSADGDLLGCTYQSGDEQAIIASWNKSWGNDPPATQALRRSLDYQRGLEQGIREGRRIATLELARHAIPRGV